ncbi:MAG: hypothetical protein WEC14_11250 [Chloroflexota bacterium]
MFKRLLAVLAIGAAIAACTPTDGGASPDLTVPTPTIDMPSEMPSEMPTDPAGASPSP